MIRFPFTSFQQFNLDWIMEQLHKILQFMPLNGVSGDVLQRTADGAAWQPITAISLDVHALNPITDDVAGNDEIPIYDNDVQGNYKATVSEIMLQAPVQSVNGQTGDVVLTIPTVPVDSVNGQTGTVVLDANDVGALPDTYTPPVTSVCSKVGAVVLDANDVGALPDTYTPPVISVCSKVGSVVLDANDVGALPDTYTPPVTSVNGMTGDVIVSGGGGSLLLGAVNNLTLTPPATATIAWQYLKGRVTADGSCIVIYGHFCMISSTSGWLEFSVSGLSITPPASAVELHGIGIVSQGKTIGGDSVTQIVDNSDDGGDIKVNIDTSGNIKISVYHAYAANDTYTPILFPIMIPIA